MKTLTSLIVLTAIVAWSANTLAQTAGVPGRGPRTGNARTQNGSSGGSSTSIGTGSAQANGGPGVGGLPGSGMAQANGGLGVSGIAQANGGPGVGGLPGAGMVQANGGLGVSTFPGTNLTQPNLSQGFSGFPGSNLAQPNISQGFSTFPGSNLNTPQAFSANPGSGVTSTGGRAGRAIVATPTPPDTGAAVIPGGANTPNVNVHYGGSQDAGLSSTNNQTTQLPTGRAAAAMASSDWRMVNKNGQWWYWSPGNYWQYYNGTSWTRYSPPAATASPSGGG